MGFILKYYRAAILLAALTILAFVIDKYLEQGVVFTGLLLGIIVGNGFIKSLQKDSPQIKFIGSWLLEFSVVFMAFAIDYKKLIGLGWAVVLVIVFVVLIMLLFTKYLARKMNCPGNTSFLIGFGTAICGSSAISALAPTIKTEKSDLGISLAVINLMGLLGMIALPLVLPNWFDMKEIALIIGGSLHAVGNVAGAGYAVNDEVGELAVAIKLGRIALLTPALLFFVSLVKSKEDLNNKVKVQIPWYLWLFIAITLVVSLVDLPSAVLSFAKMLSNILLTAAMVSIGLNMRLRELLASGSKGLIFGMVIFAVQIGLLIALVLALRFVWV